MQMIFNEIDNRSKKISKLRVTGLCVGNSPGIGEFPALMASNAENVSISWRHHDCSGLMYYSVVRGKNAMKSLIIGNSTTWWQFLPANNRQNVILHIIGSLWGDSSGGPGSLPKRPVMRKTSPYHHVFMLNKTALKFPVLWGRAHAGPANDTIAPSQKHMHYISQTLSCEQLFAPWRGNQLGPVWLIYTHVKIHGG